MTVWESEADMRAFRNSGAHLKAMPRLLRWCDEASYVHWDVEDGTLPAVAEVYARLRDGGQTSKVHHPSAAQQAGRTVASTPPLGALHLRPRRSAPSTQG